MLLHQPGEVVTREQIQHALWPSDTFVDFDHNLNSAVKRLRAALGDSAETPRFVETLPRRGYRFLVPVVVEPERGKPAAEPGAVVEPPPAAPEVAPEPAAAGGRAVRWVGFAAAVIVVAGLATWLLARDAAGGRSDRTIRSVAILPFQDFSADKGDGYFADGLTEALISSLAQVEPLRVVSRTAVMPYRDKRPDLRELARKLGVDALVEGSVIRDGDRVRITAQLIDGRIDRHLWSDTYDGRMSDVLALQNRVARQIALEVNIELSAGDEVRLSPEARVDPVVYELYLRGKHLLNRNTEPEMKRALEYFEEALRKDPGYARGHAGVALAWEAFATWPGNSPKEAYPRARAAALRAIEIDPTLVEALTCLAFIHETYDRDLSAAERAYQRAISLDPNYAPARQRYAALLARTGRNTEGVEQGRRARDLDPLSVGAVVTYGQMLFASGRFEESRQQMVAAIEIDPGGYDPYVHLAEAEEKVGLVAKAIETAERAVSLSERAPHALQALALITVRAGQIERALQVGAEMEKHPRRNPYDLAMLYLFAGRPDAGITWLRQSCTEKSPRMVHLKEAQNGPPFAAIRNDPRFLEILRCAEPTARRP